MDSSSTSSFSKNSASFRITFKVNALPDENRRVNLNEVLTSFQSFDDFANNRMRTWFKIGINEALELKWMDHDNTVYQCSTFTELKDAVEVMSQRISQGQLALELPTFQVHLRGSQTVTSTAAVMDCDATEDADDTCPLLALFNNELMILDNLAQFKESSRTWDVNVKRIFIQQWYNTCSAIIHEEWNRSNKEIAEMYPSHHSSCRRHVELSGSPGTGKSLFALFFISVLSQSQPNLTGATSRNQPLYFGQPDILLVRRDYDDGNDECARLDLLYRTMDGSPNKRSQSCRLNIEDKGVIQDLLICRSPARKLIIIVDTISPLRALDSIHRATPELVAHMCLFVGSMGTHNRIVQHSFGSRTSREDEHRDVLWSFDDLLMIVTHVRKEEFIKFAYSCAPPMTQWCVDNIIAGSGAGNTPENVLGYAFDIFGANARWPLRIGSSLVSVNENDNMYRAIFEWLQQFAPAPLSSGLSKQCCDRVLAACARKINRFLAKFESPRYASELALSSIASIEFASMFLRTTFVGMEPLPVFKSVVASASMHSVLSEWLKRQKVPIVKFLSFEWATINELGTATTRMPTVNVGLTAKERKRKSTEYTKKPRKQLKRHRNVNIPDTAGVTDEVGANAEPPARPPSQFWVFKRQKDHWFQSEF